MFIAVRGVCDVRGVAVQGTAGAGPVSDTASHAAQELPAEDFPTSPHSGKHWRCPVLHPEAVDGGPGSVLLGGENGGVGVDDDAGGADADGGDDGDDDGDDGGGGDGGGEADADTDDGDGDGDEGTCCERMALALACSIFALKSTVFSSELTTEDTFDDNTDSLSPTGSRRRTAKSRGS